jgi:hypothetical protein
MLSKLRGGLLTVEMFSLLTFLTTTPKDAVLNRVKCHLKSLKI